MQAAKADGYPFARRVTDKAELPEVLSAFVAADTPAFLEVVIDQDAGVYPMVSPGTGYKQMITGDYIPCREQPDGDEGESVDPISSSEMF